MGKQINFFMAKADLAEFLVSLSELGFWVVPRVKAADAVPEKVALTAVPSSGTSHLYLVPAELSPVEAMYHEAPTEPDKEVLSLRHSPVLEFALPTDEDRELRDGRVYFQTERSLTHYKVVQTAFNKVARLISKWPKTKKYGFYVGPVAASNVRAGRSRLLHHKEPLALAES